MKMHLAALLLAALQCACTSQPVVATTDQTLLSFARIGGEITVVYEETAGIEPEYGLPARSTYEFP